jgi:hypothetical protein
MRSARNAGQGFFPLDEELALLPGSLTPHTQESLVRLGAWMPFKPATQLLLDMLGVSVSKSKGKRYTEAAGGAYVALQTEEADEIERQAPAALPGSEKLVMSADGAMVPVLHGEWAEAKTLVIGEVSAPVLERGEWVVHTRNLSYFSRLVNSERFEHLTLSEVHRRGVESSHQVAAVMDGADWLQSLVDYHRPDAVRILDFPHAGQRLGQVAQGIWGEETPEASQWTSEQLHQLKHQGPASVLAQLHQLQEQHSELEILAGNLAYLEKREAQMQYPVFQQQSWPIGSGIVESGNKLVVEARLKGAGMHWKRDNVDPMLALRNIICSDRWRQEWPRIEQRLRQQATQRRKALWEKRHQTKQPAVSLPPAIVTIAVPAPPPLSQIDPPIETVVQPVNRTEPKRPAANHPWRRSPFGRALYRPSDPAKK